MVTDVEVQARTTGDGRRWTLRPARPTDARGLARLFDDVRQEGRWLVTPPSAVSQPSEAFFIGEMLRTGDGLALVAEADGDPIGTVQISPEQRGEQPRRHAQHRGGRWLAGRRHRLGPGASRPGWAREQGLLKVALAVFPDNARAIAVYEHAGFVREGLRASKYRADGGVLRDELLMAWFPDSAEVSRERHRRRAARGFDAWAGDYDRYRPTYPRSCSRNRLALPIPRQPHVVDLGAGTGRASLAMAELGWRVTAVEPGKPMLDVLRGSAANEGLLVSTVQATAEETGLDPPRPTWSPPPGFHWFDKDRALGEAARILKPSGGLALFWNVRDAERSPFLAEYADLLRRANEHGRSGVGRYESVGKDETRKALEAHAASSTSRN